MAVYVYDIMLTCRKDGEEESNTKIFYFTNERTAKRALKKLTNEVESITGKALFKLEFSTGYGVNYFHVADGDDYYSITLNRAQVTDLTDSNLNFNFQNDEK